MEIIPNTFSRSFYSVKHVYLSYILSNLQIKPDVQKLQFGTGWTKPARWHLYFKRDCIFFNFLELNKSFSRIVGQSQHAKRSFKSVMGMTLCALVMISIRWKVFAVCYTHSSIHKSYQYRCYWHMAFRPMEVMMQPLLLIIPIAYILCHRPHLLQWRRKVSKIALSFMALCRIYLLIL